MEKRTSEKSPFPTVDDPETTALAHSSSRLKDDPLWQVARRVAESRGFAKSRFLSRFLLYISEKHLLDRTSEITEQQIGEQVFKRAAGYRTGEDNIVRNYARLLRQRLDEYFNGEGQREKIRIIVPRGGYTPLFVENSSVTAKATVSSLAAWETDHVDSSVESPKLAVEPVITPSDGSVPAPRFLQAMCLVLGIGLMLSLVYTICLKPLPSLSDRFWTVFFNPSKDTLVVPADSGLVLYEDLTHKTIHLPEYVGGQYEQDLAAPSGVSPEIINEIGHRRYTSVVDMHLVSSISLLPQVKQGRFKVRYAREATLDDLKQSNVILIGSFEANPWVELFQEQMNFTFEARPPANKIVIRNRHPLAGEKQYYQTDESNSVPQTFGLISVMPNLDGTGHVLLIEGINMAGTEAAADYLFSEDAQRLLRQVIDARGNIVPFEVLLQTGNIGANAPRPQIVTLRIGNKVNN